jgi:hypothetical protein
MVLVEDRLYARVKEVKVEIVRQFFMLFKDYLKVRLQ